MRHTALAKRCNVKCRTTTGRTANACDTTSIGRRRITPSWRRTRPCPTRPGPSCPANMVGSTRPRRWHRPSSSTYVVHIRSSEYTLYQLVTEHLNCFARVSPIFRITIVLQITSLSARVFFRKWFEFWGAGYHLIRDSLSFSFSSGKSIFIHSHTLKSFISVFYIWKCYKEILIIRTDFS